MSTPLHVLLKADPRLEGDVADDKADPLVCLQLNQISVLQYFFEKSSSCSSSLRRFGKPPGPPSSSAGTGLLLP